MCTLKFSILQENPSLKQTETPKLQIVFVSYCPVDDITLGASFRVN